MKNKLYIYGSENPKDKGKMHIADADGKCSCGTKIKWGEITAVITKIENKQLYTKPFGRQGEISTISLLWNDAKCKECAKIINCL